MESDRVRTLASSKWSWPLDGLLATGLALLTLGICLYFAPRGFQAGFVDMGQDGYQLREVLDLSRGAVVFKDTFEQYGALNGYLNTIGFLTLGHRLLATKYFISGCYALIAIALFALARRWLDPWLAAFSTIVWLSLAPFYQHGIMITPHVYVLLIQAVAIIVMLGAERLEPRRTVLVGALNGLSWAMKQTMGAFFLGGILLYLVVRGLIGRDRWSSVRNAALAVTTGFGAVVALVLATLWWQGALRDWYLQTVAFPRDFYVRTYAAHLGWAPGVASYGAVVAKFVELQASEAWYWLIVRLGVFAGAVVLVIRRHASADLLLMAAITASLWFAAFPSSSFMHQWWTASLAFAPFVLCTRMAIARVVRQERAISLLTIAVVFMVFATGMIDRVRATRIRAANLTEVLTEPPVLSGIRTDLPTKRAFEMFYQLMLDYRTTHEGSKVISIDASDGLWNGIPESLLLLSFLDENSHPQPVYWNLPVLSTQTYPDYHDRLSRRIAAEHPLIVDSSFGKFTTARLDGYSLLAAAQSDYGNLYLYQPDVAVAERSSTFLARDGATESGFLEPGARPALAERLSGDPDGAWRGRVIPDPSRLRAEWRKAPLKLVDDALSSAGRPVNVYSWPADLKEAALDGSREAVSEQPLLRSKPAERASSGWTVDGQASAKYSTLVEYPDEQLERGTYLVARGDLMEGGFQIGFISRSEWVGYIRVEQEGPFEAIIQIQSSDQYRLVVANCVETGWWQIARHHWARELLSPLTGGFLPNRFRITSLDRLRPNSDTVAATQ